ncbi:hypothetical protein NPIL_352531 [Nephila pilipes]|uniref:Uncharacterized protein n=1 Tax=Nephila pilipes TaxID=299642 RepID=A0A8X6TJE2_NEPPI|nr:hypothetical protein NPIL_352531 [Nephila pilipes]
MAGNKRIPNVKGVPQTFEDKKKIENKQFAKVFKLNKKNLITCLVGCEQRYRLRFRSSLLPKPLFPIETCIPVSEVNDSPFLTWCGQNDVTGKELHVKILMGKARFPSIVPNEGRADCLVVS